MSNLQKKYPEMFRDIKTYKGKMDSALAAINSNLAHYDLHEFPYKANINSISKIFAKEPEGVGAYSSTATKKSCHSKKPVPMYEAN